MPTSNTVMDAAELHRIIVDAHNDRSFSGACYEVGDSRGVLVADTVGTLAWGASAVRPDTPFDIASVTKPVVGLLAMALLEAGELALEDPISRYLPEYHHTDKSTLTLYQLLTHTSGIPGQQPLYRNASTPAALLAAIRGLPLSFEPGSGVEYTSQGFIVLGQILEEIAGEPLDRCLPRLVLQPLKMDETTFGLPEHDRGRAAATELCPWRRRVIQGSVHDENAHVLGGIVGHAGLFSTAADLGNLGRMMLRGGSTGRGSLLREQTVEMMTTPHTDHLQLRRCLAWQGHDPSGSPVGQRAAADSYGHTGFTGTSVWIDPTIDRYVVLLTNAVHPQRRPDGLGSVRARFHNLAFATNSASRSNSAFDSHP